MRSALALIAAAGAFLALGVDAAPARIEPEATTIGKRALIDRSGSSVRVTGRITCTGCEAFTLGVTITQRRSGALAQGGVRCACDGARQWSVRARARTPARFEPGRGLACAWVVTRKARGASGDAFQWCANIVLTRA